MFRRGYTESVYAMRHMSTDDNLNRQSRASFAVKTPCYAKTRLRSKPYNKQATKNPPSRPEIFATIIPL